MALRQGSRKEAAAWAGTHWARPTEGDYSALLAQLWPGSQGSGSPRRGLGRRPGQDVGRATVMLEEEPARSTGRCQGLESPGGPPSGARCESWWTPIQPPPSPFLPCPEPYPEHSFPALYLDSLLFYLFLVLQSIFLFLFLLLVLPAWVSSLEWAWPQRPPSLVLQGGKAPAICSHMFLQTFQHILGVRFLL